MIRNISKRFAAEVSALVFVLGIYRITYYNKETDRLQGLFFMKLIFL